MTRSQVKIDLDMSRWDAGDWGDRLAQSLRDGAKQKLREISEVFAQLFELLDGDFIDTEIFDMVALQIAKEAIIAFFRSGDIGAYLQPDGVQLDNYVDEPILIPWRSDKDGVEVLSTDLPPRAVFELFGLLRQRCAECGFPEPTSDIDYEDWLKLRREED